MIEKIVIHCSDSPPGRGDDAETIHRWHKEPRPGAPNGWDGIGYHYVITEDGDEQAGRPWYWEGAHVKGHNENSIGICIIGKGDLTGEQFFALRKLYNELSKRWPHATWFNHYDLDPTKTCPNFDAVTWLLEDF